MKKQISAVFLLVIVCGVAAPAFAQNGCVNSPENPTVLLAMVGAASGLFVRLRTHGRR